MTMFTPVVYNSINEIKAASIYGAHSDTTINGIELFGFVGETPYAVAYEVYTDEDGYEAVYAVAGEVIFNQAT